MVIKHPLRARPSCSTYPLGVMHDAVVVVLDPLGCGVRTVLRELVEHCGRDIFEDYLHIVIPVWPRVLVEHSDGMRYFMDDHPTVLAAEEG